MNNVATTLRVQSLFKKQAVIRFRLQMAARRATIVQAEPEQSLRVPDWVLEHLQQHGEIQ